MKNLIPTINITSILKEGFHSTKSIQTINKIKKACINIGFFQITGHGISQKNIKNTCKVGNKFFNSSEKNKKTKATVAVTPVVAINRILDSKSKNHSLNIN